ncbi:MAG: hypothetical protein ACRENE_17290 [Polyangiaceae bacterium]
MATERDDERRDPMPEGGVQDPPGGAIDHRVHSAWRTWLSALAADAEAAMAAALAYESLPAEARDAWLDALEGDAPTLDVPMVALYAPLLAVEAEGSPRRRRIEVAIAASPFAGRPGEAKALRGIAPDGTHVCLIVLPVYLQFVQVLACRYTPAGGFVSVRHDPLRHADGASDMKQLDGVPVEPTPLGIVVEELAHAILADKREQRQTPAALGSFVHLFAPDLENVEGQDHAEPQSR